MTTPVFDFKLDEPFTEFEEMLGLVPVTDQSKIQLRNRLLSSGRHYHGLLHCAMMWKIHKTLSPYWQTPIDIQIASAIVYHDAIYDPHSKTNEIDSATLWLADHEAASTANGTDLFSITIDRQKKVHDAIVATADHLAARPADRLCEWFVGLDLASLGAPWEVFSLNTALIRLEYKHLSEDAWKTGSHKLMREFLDAPVIFRDPVLHVEFEQAARANITRLLTTHQSLI